MTTLARRLKRWRKTRKLTQAALAQAVGISQVRISQLERGGRHEDPSLSTLRKLAKALQVSVLALLGEKEG